MNLPLYTHYLGQLLVLLSALVGCLLLFYAALWLAWRIYRSFQGWPLILAAMRHFYETHPAEFAALKTLIPPPAKQPPPASAPTRE